MYSDAGQCKSAATWARKNVTDRQVGQDSDCNDATSNHQNFSLHAARSQVRMLTESLEIIGDMADCKQGGGGLRHQVYHMVSLPSVFIPVTSLRSITV